MSKANCRICETLSNLYFFDSRNFYICPACSLIFTNESANKEEETAHYKKQWGTAGEKFWEEQVGALLMTAKNFIGTPKKVLDFGAGSGEITKELQKRGIDSTPLEPMVNGYLKKQNYPEKFDCIFCVEVLEHIPNLWEELEELDENLASGGIIIATTLLTNSFIFASNGKEYFKQWWYKDDPTHLSFFCNNSVAIIANRLGYTASVQSDQIIIFQKT